MTDDWSALAKAVRMRRAELRLGQDDLAPRGGPSAATLRNLERGTGPTHRPRERTFFQLDWALRWPVGTALAVLEGTDPPPRISDPEPMPDTKDRNVPSLSGCSDAELVARLREIADELARRAVRDDDPAQALLMNWG